MEHGCAFAHKRLGRGERGEESPTQATAPHEVLFISVSRAFIAMHTLKILLCGCYAYSFRCSHMCNAMGPVHSRTTTTALKSFPVTFLAPPHSHPHPITHTGRKPWRTSAISKRPVRDVEWLAFNRIPAVWVVTGLRTRVDQVLMT